MNAVFELRRSSGLTQTLLAELSGVSQTTISRYETGSRTPTLAKHLRLAEAVDLRAVVLFVPMPGHKQRAAASNGETSIGAADSTESHEGAMVTGPTPAWPSSR